MMTDWQIDQFLEESTRRSARGASTAGALFDDCEPAVPSPEQRQLVESCAQVARRSGLQLLRIRLAWRHGRPDICAGAIRIQDGQMIVALSVDVDPPNLALSVLHELQHAHDLTCWPGRFTRTELEMRAVAFARETVSRLPWS